MHLGIHVVDFTFEGRTAAIAPELERVGEAVEAAGVTWLSLMDHYFQIEEVGPADDPMLEGYSALSYLAAHTSSTQLGLLVTGVTYRYPGLLAKIVTTLDVLSGGRATLGLGAAWYEREHRALGVPYPPLAERFERLEETLQICLQMWDPGTTGPYQGTHYQLAETLCSPPPLSRPRPQILVGGSGERKTLRLVAQYADACNLMGGPDEVAHKLDVLRRHCDDVGRDESTINTTTLYRGDALARGDVDGFVDEMVEFGKVGVGTVILVAPADRPSDWIARHVAPAAARVAEL